MELHSNDKSPYVTIIGKKMDNAEIHFIKSFPKGSNKEEDVIYMEFDPRDFVIHGLTERIKKEKGVDIDFKGESMIVISKAEYDRLTKA